MTDQQMYAALVAQLQTVDGLPKLQTENTGIILEGETVFVRATNLYTRPSQLTVGATGRDLHQGIFQVDVFVPTDIGTTTANGLVEKIISAFPRGLQLGSGVEKIRIRMVYRSTALRLNDQFHQVPVSIEWAAIRGPGI